MTQGQQESRSDAEQPTQVDVMAEILERAGLDDINEVPLGTTFAWGKAGVWTSEEPVPLTGYSEYMIFAMFQSSEEVRVYAVPKGVVGKFPVCFTLCKRSPAYFVEIIRSKDVFVDEIAKDLVLLAMRGNVKEDDEEGRIWAACMGSAMTRLSVVDAAKLADAAVGEYNERQEQEDEEDEDEDEDEEETEAAPNGGARPPAV